MLVHVAWRGGGAAEAVDGLKHKAAMSGGAGEGGWRGSGLARRDRSHAKLGVSKGVQSSWACKGLKWGLLLALAFVNQKSAGRLRVGNESNHAWSLPAPSLVKIKLSISAVG